MPLILHEDLQSPYSTSNERGIANTHGTQVQRSTEHLRQPGSRWMNNIWQRRGWDVGGVNVGHARVAGDQHHQMMTEKQVMRQKVKDFGRFLQILGSCGKDLNTGMNLAHGAYGESSWVFRALQASVPTAGGILLQPEVLDDIIEFLRSKEVVRNFGPQTIDLTTGTAIINKLTGTANTSYVGELPDDETSQLSTGAIVMSRKKLLSRTSISNDLLRFGSGADNLVAQDLAAGMGVAMDAAFIRANGTAFTPKGLKYWAQASNVFNAQALAGDDTDIQTITDDLNQAILNLTGNDVILDNPGWIFAPRVKQFLMTKYSANAGVRVWGDEMSGGTLLGAAFDDTTSIPVTLGGGTESEVYMVEFSHVIIGDASNGLIIDTSDVASYNEGGSQVSAFTQDTTVVRVIDEHDLAVRHDEAVSVIEAVTWGA